MSGLGHQKDVIAHGEKSVTAFITSSLYYWKKLQKKKKIIHIYTFDGKRKETVVEISSG